MRQRRAADRSSAGGYRAGDRAGIRHDPTRRDTDADTVAVGAVRGRGPARRRARRSSASCSSSARRERSLKALALDPRRGQALAARRAGRARGASRPSARGWRPRWRASARARSRPRALCWQAPERRPAAIAAALVEGTVLADYRFERYKSAAPEAERRRQRAEAPRAPDRLARPTERASSERGRARPRSSPRRSTRARDLQNRPGNDLTPTALGEYARGAGRARSTACRSRWRAATGIRGARHGRVRRGRPGLRAGARADHAALRAARRASGPPMLGFVGKAVTFDSGGISLKPGAKMAEMKFDMSGGAAVIEAVAAIARLRAAGAGSSAVVGATENLPSGRSVKPGDIVTAANGKTIEVNNTDAEGRLVLADCLCHAVALGRRADRRPGDADRRGDHRARLDLRRADEQRRRARRARHARPASARGEIVWRLPLHEEYDELIKGTYGDLDNAPEARKAGTIVGARVPVELRRRDALGAPRHRRLGLGPRPRLRRQGRLRLRRAAAGRAARARTAPSAASGCADRHGLRPLPRPRADPAHGREFAEGEVAPVAEELDRTKSFPYEIVAQAGRAEPDGDPLPRGVRRRRRRHARLRARGRGAHARGLLGRDHAVRAHLARHPADLPVRLRGAEARVAAAAVLGRAARRVRPDRARGRLGRRQHAHARAPGRRRMGDRRRQAVHHQRRHRHLRDGLHHGGHRRRDATARRSRTSSSPTARPATSRASPTARWAGTPRTRAR